jgi:hypothetical protein
VPKGSHGLIFGKHQVRYRRQPHDPRLECQAVQRSQKDAPGDISARCQQKPLFIYCTELKKLCLGTGSPCMTPNHMQKWRSPLPLTGLAANVVHGPVHRRFALRQSISPRFAPQAFQDNLAHLYLGSPSPKRTKQIYFVFSQQTQSQFAIGR